jgi:HK97 family phage major capsid protein
MSIEIKEMLDEGLKAINAENAKLAEKQSALEKSMEKYHGQLDEKSKVDGEIKNEVKSLAEEFAKINADITAMGQKMAEGFKGTEEKAVASAGDEFVKSEQFKQLITGQSQRVRFEVKNTVTSGSTTVFPFQKPGVIGGDFAPLTIRQVLPSIGVSTNMVNSLREEAWTNDAAGVNQGAAKPESDITFEQYNVPVETIAHWIKVSNQLLADAPAIAAYINTRLRDGLAQKVDSQLLNGTGTAPQLSGLTDSGNFTAYTATAGDNLVDAINRAKYQLWAIGRMPDTVIVNPADWSTMELTREGSGTGMYLYGLPGQLAGANPFGVRVVMSNNMGVGKFLIGSLNTSTVVYNRQGAVVEMGYINDDFTKNLVTIRAEERLGLGVERPSGILYGDFTAEA